MTYCSIICQTLVWYQDHVFINIGCQYWILNLDQDWVQYLPNMGMVLGPCLDQYWMPIRFPTLDQDWKSNIGQTWVWYQDLAWINIKCQKWFPTLDQDWKSNLAKHGYGTRTLLGSILNTNTGYQHWTKIGNPILAKHGHSTRTLLGSILNANTGSQHWTKIGNPILA